MVGHLEAELRVEMTLLVEVERRRAANIDILAVTISELEEE